MLKVKLSDLQLAIDYMKNQSHSEYITIDDNEVGGAALSLEFVDKLQKVSKVFLYEASKGITPEVRVTTKLYKQEK